MSADLDLFPAAAALAGRAGLPHPISLVALSAGKNNRVFAVGLADGESVILKAYFSDARDTRDRLGAESAFLAYARARGLRNIPKPLAYDPERRLGLFARLSGSKISPGGVVASHVDAALDFVIALNAPPRDDSESLPAASEACFSGTAHIATVERRVHALATLDSMAPLRAEVEHFVVSRLTPVWRKVRTRVEIAASRSSVPLNATLEPEAVIVSPSDFGFHNALLDGELLGFLDFEYAGRDDPAKLVCDFFCQPEVPVPIAYFPHAVERMIGSLGLADAHKQRCNDMLDLYRIKWVCIILNHFQPLGAARRAFADRGAREADYAAQLAKASTKLDEISP